MRSASVGGMLARDAGALFLAMLLAAGLAPVARGQEGVLNPPRIEPLPDPDQPAEAEPEASAPEAAQPVPKSPFAASVPLPPQKPKELVAKAAGTPIPDADRSQAPGRPRGDSPPDQVPDGDAAASQPAEAALAGAAEETAPALASTRPAFSLGGLFGKPLPPPSEEGAQASSGGEPALASLTPTPSLPLPPSMKDGQPPEPESDGEEEAANPGSFEKQIEAVDLSCVKPAVLDIVKRAGVFFHAVPIITSGFRARGRRGSLHRRCMAVDFMIPGISTSVIANYLRSQPDAGGVGTYCNTKLVHVDIGEKRNWGYCGFHRTYFSLR